MYLIKTIISKMIFVSRPNKMTHRYLNGIPRHRGRGSQDQLRGRREFLTKWAVQKRQLSLHRTVIRICGRPNAARFIDAVAFDRI